jgi:LCP family protein required for cell wall assembly
MDNDDDQPDPAGPTAAGAAAASSGARHFRASTRALRRWPHRLLVGANVVVLLLITASAVVAGYVVFELDQIHRIRAGGLVVAPRTYVIIKGKKVRVASSSSPPFTVLLVGSDSRAGDNSGPSTGNDIANSENLSDSIILARVSPATHQAALLSIPRDLWVSIPGVGMGKINAAFAGGDPTRLIEVIEQDLGIPVNHFAEVSFHSFEQIADAIGGVEQYFPTPAFDQYSNLKVTKAGCVNLIGAQALAFVRSRHYYYQEPGQYPEPQLVPESDLGRIQRQQAFIKNAIDKIKREGDLTNPVTLTSLVGSITRNLTVDNTFSDGELITLAEDFSHVDANAIPNTTYPVQNYFVDGTDALSGIPAADAATIAQFESVGTVDAGTSATSSTSQVTAGRGTGSRVGATTTTSTTVAPGDISVEVENGSGVAGQAGAAGADLEGAGYVLAGTDDAADFDYVANVVDYGPEGLAAARTLQASLAGGATLTADPSLTGTSLVLITGSAWDGLGTAPSPGTSSPTTPASTTTVTVPPSAGTIYGSSPTVEADSSSYVHGVYIPPGREPGQAVETCGN